MMRRAAVIAALIALILLFGCCGAGTIAETEAAQKESAALPPDAENDAGAGLISGIAERYGVDLPDLSVEDVLNAPQAFLGMLADAFAAPVREAAERLRRVLLPAALLMVMQAGTGGNGSAPLLACRMAVLIGCIQIAEPAVRSAQECILRAMDFSDTAAPVAATALTACGMTGRAALLSPASALIGDICQKAYAGYGLALTRAALCLSAADGLSGSPDLSGLIGALRRLVNWGSGLIGSLFAALIAYAGANAFAQDTVAMRAAKYAFDSASGVIGGTSELWGGSIAGVLALRNVFGRGGTAVVIAVCLRPMAAVLLALLSLRLLSALLRLFGDGRVSSAVDQLSGVCRMALMLSCSAAAIVIVLIGSVVSIGTFV